ncbi:urea transporter [bacterium]|nr:urea transporter [bacterium]
MIFWLNSFFLSYSQIFFSYKIWLGVVIFFATFFSPWVGIGGIISLIIAIAFAKVMRYSRDFIEKGYLTFNSLLIGLEIAYFFKPNIASIVLIIIASIGTVLATVVLNHLFSLYFNIPSMAMPFVINSVLLYFATYHYIGLKLHTPLTLFNFKNIFPEIVEIYFHSLGALFFQNSLISGVIIALIILIYSPIFTLFSVIGFATGVIFYSLMGGAILGIGFSFIGFNFILASAAIGTIFFVASKSSIILSIFASIITALLASAIKTFVLFYGMPVFALPFHLAIFLIILSFRLRGVDRDPKLVDFVPGKPEENLFYYYNNIARFNLELIQNQLLLPFREQWIVSQGVDGEFTHKENWRWALDFQKLTHNGAVFEGEGVKKSDYPTFGAQILAPIAGTVVALENSIIDNEIGEINTIENWGNYVLIHCGFSVYVKVAHLKENSITVKVGDILKEGDFIGLAGNSGRSPYPHLHFQLQFLPYIGSETLKFSFKNLILKDETSKKIVKTDYIPQKGDIVSYFEKDHSFANSFRLDAGFKYTFHIKKNDNKDENSNENSRYLMNNGFQPIEDKTKNENIKSEIEIIESKIDLYGQRYLSSSLGGVLYFSVDSHFIYFLDYKGKNSSILEILHKKISKIPLFYEENLFWSDEKYEISKSVLILKNIFFSPKKITTNLSFGKKIKWNSQILPLIKFDTGRVGVNKRFFISFVELESIIYELEEQK